jgi:hypothetical protein
MIIDSPIVSGSFLSTGSLSQIGNATITGSLNVSGSGISLTDGTFSGSGANLFNIPAAGIVGLNLSQIASGSVSASISPDRGLLINTRVSASNFTGSFTGSLTGIATSASYAAFALTSSYSLGGSGFPFSGSAEITGSLLVSGSGLTITGSLSVSTLTTGSGVRYVIADANGLISAQTASAAIFVTQKDIATAGQTSFNVVNGYSTGYVTVFVNGTKLSADEYTDTSGTTIVLATGSMANDVVEFQKYMPAAGVSNNALRQINYFTTTLGQTNFTVNYTPGLLDVFYNGSKLSNVEYTANNGTSITLATGSNSGDTLEVDVYSYQVGAFSGIGGSGAANQLAYFNTTNSITGSNNFTVSGSSIIITGSLIVSGSGTLINIGPAVFSGSVTAVGGFSGSFSGNADSASLAQNSLLLQGTGSVGFTTTASFNAVSSSQQQISSSLLNVISVFATTGSNSFRETQSITGSLTVTGQIIAQSINVQQVTSSIIYSSGSNVFGCDINSRQTFTGSFYQTGSIAVFNSCVGIGLNNPTNRLEVQSGNIKLNAGASRCTSVSFGITGTDYGKLEYSDMDGSLFLTTLGASSGYDLRLGTRCVTRLTIAGDGNVGIGTTTPCNLMHIRSAITGDVILARFTNSPGTGNEGAFIGFETGYVCGLSLIGAKREGAEDDASIIFAPMLNQASCERMRITSGGRVGIGVTSPSAQLDVYQVAGPLDTTTCNALLLRAGGNSNIFCHNQILFGYNGTANYAHAIKTRHNSNGTCDNAIDFYTWRCGDAISTPAGQYVMTIAGDGRLGIGTCFPLTLLDARCAVPENCNGSVLNSHPISTFVVNASGGGQRGLQFGGPTGGVISPVFLKVFGTGNRFSILNESNCENLIVTSGGSIRQPFQPAFQVFRGVGADCIITNTAEQRLTFQCIRYDVGSNTNNSGIFTAPFCGRYAFSSTVRFDGASTDASYIRLFFTINGCNGTNSSYTFGHAIAGPGSYSTNYHTMSISAVLNLNAGDNVAVNGGLNTGTIGVQFESQFSGYMIG